VRRPFGFTLIEVLASMAVLAVGLTSVISVIFATKSLANTAIDRNLANSIIREAVEGISRAHLVVPNMVGALPPVNPGDPDVGLLLETTASSPTNDANIQSSRYKNVQIYNSSSYTASFLTQFNDYCGLKCFHNSFTPTNTMLWPYGRYPIFLPAQTVPAPKCEAGLPSRVDSNPNSPVYRDGCDIIINATSWALAYRVIYSLERHPDWIANQTLSQYAGVYVLTLVIYRDLDRQGGSLVRVTDPFVVYLRDQQN
jgi:prepilin-type N-terminal cleavage/methylation domain-containing protein